MSRIAAQLIKLTAQVGFTQAVGRIFERALDENFVSLRRGKLKSVIDLLGRLYDDPSLTTFCEVVGHIPEHLPDEIRIREPESFRAIGSLRPIDGQDPIALLNQALAVRKRQLRVAPRIASTIHKSKGLEFDHVMICNFSSTQFPEGERGRKLAYVALSRAKKSIEILVPGNAPSPLLG